MSPELLTFVQATGLVCAGFISALAALTWMRLAPMGMPGQRQTSSAPEIAFLFDGETLVDASDAGQRLLDLTEPAESDITRLVKFLAPRFPDLFERVMGCDEAEDFELTSLDGHSVLHLSIGAERLRLTLQDHENSAPTPLLDRLSLTALDEELNRHRMLSDTTPFPVWRQSGDGKIRWANAEYRRLMDLLDLKRPTPLCFPPIFEIDSDIVGSEFQPSRASLDLPSEQSGSGMKASQLRQSHWYEFQVTRSAEELLVAAIPIDRVVKAEHSLQEFVQALTQTFAHLSVGLAIFSRGRELALFNPALSDMLELPAEFLITRPTLFQVFDRLRDQRLIPEPKNYAAWRRKMSDLEAAASGGAYSEMWSLVDGRTYRVTGRPHPQGAVAFLFEDISAEISLTRHFRAELQMSNAVIDGLDEAIAVFAPTGALVMSNTAYCKLWHVAAPSGAKDTSFLESSRNWQKACLPTPIWGDVRDFAATIGERVSWNGEVRMRNGRRLGCRFDALSGGYTLIGFSDISEVSFRNKIVDDRESALA